MDLQNHSQNHQQSNTNSNSGSLLRFRSAPRALPNDSLDERLYTRFMSTTTSSGINEPDSVHFHDFEDKSAVAVTGDLGMNRRNELPPQYLRRSSGMDSVNGSYRGAGLMGSVNNLARQNSSPAGFVSQLDAQSGNSLWPKLLIGFGAAAAAIGMLSITSISIIIWCRCVGKVSHNDEKVEALIKQHGSLALKRYRYSDIKKMTSSLKEKLGQGGYGGVYKGKLPDGRLVAVKVLHNSKGNGEEFINEVASISRTSHVNVVNLFGFCFEGHKRALIYEFMPNGSLDKFKDDRSLGLERIYLIVCGIARGLEYLHHGCNTRILHLDIKPHNILLDDFFCPKIADFGLAKLCSTKDVKVSSMLCARGTIGYIAPEVFNRGFGRVSHKSDIYSYGMMILEIVGGKQNIVDGLTESSEMYFPDCFYNHLDQAQNDSTLLEGIVMNEMESHIARKMILVGLWCIQTDPAHRPSIGKVIDMLEGSVDALQIPPRPVLSLPPRPSEDAIPSSYSATLSMSDP